MASTTGDIVVTAGVQALHPGQKVRLLGPVRVVGFNLSEWALEHRSFVVYCMIASIIAGVISFYRLGSNEDPAFVIKTMVVQAAWPGATLNDTLARSRSGSNARCRRRPRLDFLRSFTRPGVTTIFVNLKGETTAARGARHLVPCPQERRRHAPHLAGGRRRAGLQ